MLTIWDKNEIIERIYIYFFEKENMIKSEQKFLEDFIMKKVKIVHTADLHFDTPFNEVDDKQRAINKEELKEVFKNIINFVKKSK